MAGSSLLALIDDIASVLDDVAILTKVAAKKTSGVLGDDLALNAQQVTGVNADRELPVVWAVAKGSFINKLILVPAALLISVIAPWLITPLLMIGGLFLCFEGFEKVHEKLFHKKETHKKDLPSEEKFKDMDLVAFEQEKIKGAVRTDFILSAEIIAITLGSAAAASIGIQAMVLSGISIVMTVGVYGLVALIVKLDDFGIYLTQKNTEVQKKIGFGILKSAPYLMKSLGVIGTVAMFLVGGGIIAHGIPAIHHFNQAMNNALIEMLVNGGTGLVSGWLVYLIVLLIKTKFRSTSKIGE